MVYTWDKGYVTYDGHDVEPVYIFLSDSGGTGKFHLVNIHRRIRNIALLF